MFYRFLQVFLLRTNGFVSPVRSNRNVSNGDSSTLFIIVFIGSGFDGKNLMTQNGNICVALWEIHLGHVIHFSIFECPCFFLFF